MARKKKQEGEAQGQEAAGSMDFNLTKEHLKMLMSLVYHQHQIKLAQESFSESVKETAAKINAKPGEVKEMVGWIIQEQEKGGVLEAKEKKLELTRQVIDFLDANPSGPPAAKAGDEV